MANANGSSSDIWNKTAELLGSGMGLTADYGCSSCCSFGVPRDIKVAIIFLFLDQVVFMVVIMFHCGGVVVTKGHRYGGSAPRAPLGPHQGRSSDHESAFAFAFV